MRRKNKKPLKQILTSLVFILIAAVSIAVLINKRHAIAPSMAHTDTRQATSEKIKVAENPQTQQPIPLDKNMYSLTKPNSLWLIVNKNRPLPDHFTTPSDLRMVNIPNKGGEESKLRSEAASAIENLAATAKTDGTSFVLASGYRSVAMQTSVYNNYVTQYGKTAADRFSARPGTSEHHTGLAADLGQSDGSCRLETCFGATQGGKWLASHAYEYGFVIRYPEGKENITGYQYEPWHIRYVGKELATEIHKSGQTLEEFFGL